VNDIELQLSTLLGQITALPEGFDADSDLIDDLALESMQVMEFVMEAEDHFDVAIAQDRLADVRTLGQFAAVIEKLLAPAG
jgi:acyl carrier protein